MPAPDPTYAGGYRLVSGRWVLTAPPAAPTGVEPKVVTSALQVTGNVGFYNTAPAAKPSITGSRGGNAALADLLTKLAALGLITNGTTV